MQRTLEPEWLDSLPPTHPDALHNRRDLRLTNVLLGNHRWIERTLRRHRLPAEAGLEIGAGVGDLGRRLARRGVLVAGLDLWPRPQDWSDATAWHRADLRTFDGYAAYPVIVGNLIFHQFSDVELADLGQKLRSAARLIVAAEPARRRASQVLFRAIAPLFGANHVSLHDAHVSIAAGFRKHELPRALGLDSRQWRIHCHSTVLGAYRMIAERLP